MNAQLLKSILSILIVASMARTSSGNNLRALQSSPAENAYGGGRDDADYFTSYMQNFDNADRSENIAQEIITYRHSGNANSEDVDGSDNTDGHGANKEDCREAGLWIIRKKNCY
jgi:hypothetical protein